MATTDLSIGPLLISTFESEDLAFCEVCQRNGEAYVNVHTTENPDGAIRGQIGFHRANKKVVSSGTRN